MRLANALNIGDLRRLAKRRLPRVLFEVVESGVDDEEGVARNEEAFRAWRLLPRYLVDVKSTGLFATDPVLIANKVKADYWKTGHSYMKRRVNESGAMVGFEKSGHFFFNKPFGRGYDDGLVSAIAVCDMLDRNPGKSMSDLKNDLPKTWSSPTMSPHCDDEKKYGIVDAVVKHFEKEQKSGGKVAGQAIRDLVTVNGVRVTVEDGTWGLVRASSNKPELVVVVESPASEARMREMFKAVDGVLRTHPEVGEYNQTI